MTEPGARALALRIEACVTPCRRAIAPTVWPGRITEVGCSPLAARMPDSEVPSRSAIARMVSPGCTVYPVQRRASTRAASCARDVVRGTDSRWPRRRYEPPPVSPLWATSAPTVVRWAVARSLRVSPGRTTWVCHPYGAGCAEATTGDVGEWAATDVGGVRLMTALMLGSF